MTSLTYQNASNCIWMWSMFKPCFPSILLNETSCKVKKLVIFCSMTFVKNRMAIWNRKLWTSGFSPSVAAKKRRAFYFSLAFHSIWHPEVTSVLSSLYLSVLSFSYQHFICLSRGEVAVAEFEIPTGNTNLRYHKAMKLTQNWICYTNPCTNLLVS